MEPSTDFVSLALRLEQPEFLSQCPFAFLLAVNEPVAADEESPEQTTLLFSKEPPPPATQPWTGRARVLAVRKVHSLIPQSIILGRASTSDIVIADRQISKVHALFQGAGERWELSDAGSRNGTWIGHRKLEPRGEAGVVQSCDVLSFGHRAFLFLDSADCWKEIRQRG